MRVRRFFIDAKKVVANQVEEIVEITHELDETGSNFGPFHSIGKSIPSYGFQPVRSKDRLADPAFKVETPEKNILLASKLSEASTDGIHLDSLAWKIF
jgi:hypothetical protein